MITEEQSRKILEEVMERREWRLVIQPEEFYRAQLEREWGKSRTEVDGMLKKWKKRGLVTCRPARTRSGKGVTAYRFVDGVDVEELMKE